MIYDGEVEGAIAVYMDHAVGENETDMDLAEKQRAARILNLQRNQGLFMEHLTMKGKITPVFCKGRNTGFEDQSQDHAAFEKCHVPSDAAYGQ